MKKLEIKKNHHYVPASYLKAWSKNNSDVFHTTAKNKVVRGSIKGISKEIDFYKMTTLSTHHIDVVKLVASYSPAHLREVHMAVINDFHKIQNIEAFYKNCCHPHQDLDARINALKSNSMENIYAADERDFFSILNRIKDRDFNCLRGDRELSVFFSYIGHQFTRTKRFKDAFLNTERMKAEPEYRKLYCESWFLISYILGVSYGYSLFATKESRHICFLVNETEEPFITSDHPIINLLGVGGCTDSEFERSEPYYPLSPSIAVVIGGSSGFKRGCNKIGSDVALKLNKMLASQSHTYIIGVDEGQLKILNKHRRT